MVTSIILNKYCNKVKKNDLIFIIWKMSPFIKKINGIIILIIFHCYPLYVEGDKFKNSTNAYKRGDRSIT